MLKDTDKCSQKQICMLDSQDVERTHTLLWQLLYWLKQNMKIKIKLKKNWRNNIITNLFKSIIAWIVHSCFQTWIKSSVAYCFSCVACIVADIVSVTARAKARQAIIFRKVNINIVWSAAVESRSCAWFRNGLSC